MRAKSFFLTIIITVLISSCSKEILKNPHGPEPVEEGYLMVVIKNIPSKITPEVPVDYGTTSENKINSLTVVLTDASGYIKFVATPSIKDGITEEFKVAVGEYYVYALANSQISVLVGRNINQVITDTDENNTISGYHNGQFLMVNQRSTGSEQAGVHTIISKQDTPAIAVVYVDRVVCKIIDKTNYETNRPSVNLLADATENFINDVSIQGFTILNVNKDFYLVQTWSPFNLSGISIDTEILSTPFSNSNFVTNQYFNNINKYTSVSKDFNNNITGITDKTAGTTGIYSWGPVYTTENRPSIINICNSGITASKNEATGVIYKVQAKNGDRNLETFYKYEDILTDNIKDIQDLPEFSYENLSVLSIPSLRALGIQVYENGIMYYSYFILDPDMAHLYEDNYYYAVFRNSTYNLKINSITALGDDVPGGAAVNKGKSIKSENAPIDTKDIRMKIYLNVSSWKVNIINTIL